MEHFYLKYEIRYLLLKTHYELKNYEAVLSLIDSTLHFIRKNKNAFAQRRQNFINFLNFLRKITILSCEHIGHDTEILKNEILSQEIIMQKQWLLEKLNEISL